MRTSGAGARDGLMTAVPLGMLVVFVVWMAGGPKATVAWLEGVLRSTVVWVKDVMR
jgi:hypothetical protein